MSFIGKRSHLSAEKAEKQATIYGAACIEKSRSVQDAEEKLGLLVESRWSDADIALQMGLENWEGQVDGGGIPVPVAPRRLFRAWIEDWEWDAMHRNDPLMEAKLVQKYAGLWFLDPDPIRVGGRNVFDKFWIQSNLEYQGGRSGPGWCLLGMRERTNQLEPWIIHLTIDEIADYEQPAELNVEVIINEELRAANYERIAEEEKPSARKRKAK